MGRGQHGVQTFQKPRVGDGVCIAEVFLDNRQRRAEVIGNVMKANVLPADSLGTEERRGQNLLRTDLRLFLRIFKPKAKLL